MASNRQCRSSAIVRSASHTILASAPNASSLRKSMWDECSSIYTSMVGIYCEARAWSDDFLDSLEAKAAAHDREAD